MLCGSKLRAALSSHLRRHSSAFSLPLRRFSSTVTAAATATMASNQHPKDESYLNQVIPKRIQLFQSIQAKLLTERLSLSSDPIKYISPKNPNPRIFHTHSILIWIFFFFFLKDYVAGWDCEGREEVGDIAIGRCERDFEEFGFQRFDFWGQWGSLGHV